MTHFDDHIITREAGPSWDDAPQWVGWWQCNVGGDSWWWQCRPEKHEWFWLATEGYAPTFAGWAKEPEQWWEDSLRNKPENNAILGNPPEVV